MHRTESTDRLARRRDTHGRCHAYVGLSPQTRDVTVVLLHAAGRPLSVLGLFESATRPLRKETPTNIIRLIPTRAPAPVLTAPVPTPSRRAVESTPNIYLREENSFNGVVKGLLPIRRPPNGPPAAGSAAW